MSISIGLGIGLTTGPNTPATPAVPVITGVPTISGTETEGKVLTATAASVSGVPTPTRTWQWERGGVAISGATSSTYTLVSADVGNTLTVVQTETNTEGSDTAESAATGTIAAGYNPVTELFGASEKGFLFDLTAASDDYMYEDSAKTTLCTAAADPVGAVADRSGNGTDLLQSVNTNYRPEVLSGGGFGTDGVDDYLATAAIDLSGGCNLTIIMAVKYLGSGTGAADLINHNLTAAGSFSLRARESGGNVRFDAKARPAGVGEIAPNTAYDFAASSAHLVTLTVNQTSGDVILRVNGVQEASGSDTLTTGTFSNDPVRVGSKTNDSSFANAEFLNFTVVDKCLTGTDLTDAEAYFASQAGITL